MGVLPVLGREESLLLCSQEGQEYVSVSPREQGMGADLSPLHSPGEEQIPGVALLPEHSLLPVPKGGKSGTADPHPQQSIPKGLSINQRDNFCGELAQC